MLFTQSKNRFVLPSNLNSHQVMGASKIIHDRTRTLITPLLETKPQYVAVNLILDKVELAIGQLKAAHQRKFQGPQKLRRVGGQDGKLADQTASKEKRRLYAERRAQMRRFRTMVNWHYNPKDGGDNSLKSAGVHLAEILNGRVEYFETLSYVEAMTECDYFIETVDADTLALDAISQIGLTAVYSDIKSLQQQFKDLLVEQTSGDARREESPKVSLASRELRLAVRQLLSLMYFDTANGDPTFAELLGDFDEVMDKEHATAARRITLAKKEAEKKASGQTSTQEKTEEKAEDKADPDQNTDQEEGQKADQAEDQKNDQPETPDATTSTEDQTPSDTQEQEGVTDKAEEVTTG